MLSVLWDVAMMVKLVSSATNSREEQVMWIIYTKTKRGGGLRKVNARNISDNRGEENQSMREKQRKRMGEQRGRKAR